MRVQCDVVAALVWSLLLPAYAQTAASEQQMVSPDTSSVPDKLSRSLMPPAPWTVAYRAELSKALNSHILQSKRHLEVFLTLTVDRAGHVARCELLRTSGETKFDTEVLAMVKSLKLPRLPASAPEDTYTTVIRMVGGGVPTYRPIIRHG